MIFSGNSNVSVLNWGQNWAETMIASTRQSLKFMLGVVCWSSLCMLVFIRLESLKSVKKNKIKIKFSPRPRVMGVNMVKDSWEMSEKWGNGG